MARTCLALILAAGEGTRMRSELPKVLHPVAGAPMLQHVLRISQQAGCSERAVVVGSGAESVSQFVRTVSSSASIYEQVERLGTGHAVLCARQALECAPDDVLILFGDTPLVRPETLASVRKCLASGASICVVGFRTANPSDYGRLIIKQGNLVAIREARDALPDELQIDFCNGGIMGIAGENALTLLEAIGNNNAKTEYYLTDVVEIANDMGLSVAAVEADERELTGVNTREDLAFAEAAWQQGRRRELLLSGVTMTAPETVFFSHDTKISPDVVIEPNVMFGPGVSVGSGTRIKAFTCLEGADIGEGVQIGPYARLRPGSRLAKNTKVGNFVELKKAVIHEGAKVNHLSYIGDCVMGANANIGAGTITCNYDGHNKHLTQIGAGAFIGSNSALVAPVKIGEEAYVASGSVVTDNVPENALAFGRARQTNKENYATKITMQKKDLKSAGKVDDV